jgi:adenine-specific DNA glycosylase
VATAVTAGTDAHSRAPTRTPRHAHLKRAQHGKFLVIQERPERWDVQDSPKTLILAEVEAFPGVCDTRDWRMARQQGTHTQSVSRRASERTPSAHVHSHTHMLVQVQLSFTAARHARA